ncbi:MAG: flagellar biosynthesis anti-sigma factor FlgM [Halothiobacillaceae bacterium]
MTSIDNLTGRPRPLETSVSERSRAGSAASHNKRTGEAAADSITLTETGSQIAAASREMAATPAFDSAKVERIKELIAEGRYSIDPQRIANRFIELESSLGKS